jgi:hypothetical protein
MQNCRGHTSGIAETLQITAAPKRKASHSSRASEGSGRVRIVSIMLFYFFPICFRGSNRNTRLAVFIGAAGGG